ncbi:hypothetical protein [Mycobacterium stomatepiae]|uniref:Uncharacterized protein n=1 Tax=Mycobacterium stomatepiae TaxID=470076 RepID=A0A7I7QD16_9MYCO|nr:hypothetical protein [Mycobacterium stomatepiae]MCV7167976.1 hypothetical protein [Mycobacterium stomatepiae]BBY23926.1 hypothetical protein MSTO_41310 [Mycobacterium stomatepiae]
MSRLERGLARLRDMRFDLYEQPLRQVSVELKIVFVAIHLPIAGGKTLKIPMIATVGPMPGKSKDDEHPDSDS